MCPLSHRHPSAAPALHLRRWEDEAAGSGALRPAHVEALPFVGAIADARFQEAEGPCETEKNGTGQTEPPTHRPSWRPPGCSSPCSEHRTASIAGRHGRGCSSNRPIPPSLHSHQSARGRGGAANRRCAVLSSRPREPEQTGGEMLKRRGHTPRGVVLWGRPRAPPRWRTRRSRPPIARAARRGPCSTRDTSVSWKRL